MVTLSTQTQRTETLMQLIAVSLGTAGVLQSDDDDDDDDDDWKIKTSRQEF